jgi:transcriptional regulator with XRE-family HTH domain
MKFLAQYLSDKDLSQKAFAQSIGVTQATVSDWKRGVQFPTMKNLRRVSEITGIAVSQLLDAGPQ